MLRFLRQTRKNLMESSKVRTYIFYAIGEIALVMIGILLALQVNNWNEEKALQKDLNIYLTKKLDNLNEDQQELQMLYDYRMQATKSSTKMLDTGLKKAPTKEVVDFLLMITVEKRFISSIQREQSNEVTDYFKTIKESKISDLEIDYMNLTDGVTFDEFRHNNFSEDLESDLWRAGFFTVNRVLFEGLRQGLEEVPDLILTDELGLRSLEAIIRRNEISNRRLAVQYAGLMDLNQKLRTSIQEYLENQ